MEGLPTTVVDAQRTALRADPGRPLVTFYDARIGERVELSVATADNWVNKLVNLFSDELGLQPGDEVAVELPASWQAVVVVLAAWSAGLVVSVQDGATPALRVVGPAALAGHLRAAEPVLACSLRPLGARFDRPLPPGWLDFAVEVPGQPDLILAPVAVSASDEAVRTAEGASSHGQLVDTANGRALEMGLHRGGRLLTDVSPASEVGLISCVTAPLVTDSSLVLLIGAGDAARARIEAQERVTCLLWSAG